MPGRVLLLVLLATPAFGAERSFAYTYQSDVLEAGKSEGQVDLAYRTLRHAGYDEVDSRLGFDFGLTRYLEGQLLLDYAIITPDAGDASLIAYLTGSLRARLADAHTDPVGVGFEAAASIGPDHGRLLARAVVDKWFGRLLLAFNALASETFGDDLAPTRFEESLGLSYQLPIHLSAGFELRNRHALDDHAHFLGDALYAGPTLNLRVKKVWTALSLLMQVGALKAKAQQGNGEPNEVLDNERFNLRLVVGFDL